MSAFEADTQIALSDLRGVLELDERSGPDLCHHGQRLRRLPATRRPSLNREPNSNFDPAAFVAGDPEAYNPLRLALAGPNSTPLEGLDVQLGHQGRFDTVYITASSDSRTSWRRSWPAS